MRAAVQLEDPIAEVLDAEAEARHAHVADRFELRLGQRAGLAFERHLLGRRPTASPPSAAITSRCELAGREKRRRAAAEVHEVQRPTGDRRRRRDTTPTRAPSRSRYSSTSRAFLFV